MEVITIQVSPQTILIGADQAELVTVHADIPYNTVAKDLSITLDAIEVTYTKSDLRGDLVAKFNSSAIKGALKPGTATLTLSGTKTDGTGFTGSCEVRVVEFSAPSKPSKK